MQRGPQCGVRAAAGDADGGDTGQTRVHGKRADPGRAVEQGRCVSAELSRPGGVARRPRGRPQRPATPCDTPQHPATPRASPPARPAAQGKHPRQARVPVRPFGEPRVRRRAVPRGSAREVWPGRPSFLHEHKGIKLIRKAFDELLSLGCIILETIRIKCMF